MTITIDKAGRVVLPKNLREMLNLFPGTALEVEARADEIRLRVADRGPALIEKQGVLVHHGGETIQLDVADFINREREAHALGTAQAGI